MIPLKAYFAVIASVALIVAFLLYRHSLIAQGEQIAQARERAAADKQAIEDTKIAEETAYALHLEIGRLRGMAAAPADTGRVQCYARRVPAAASKPGAARPGEPATPAGIIPAVPAGTGTGVEVGADLQRLALAADVVSARDRACLKELQEP